eukprot:TRINITY_DN5566_c0_g1_i1.p1 TRINITY_DN5566_c0_g1~~TRINITY_DN5566_c0_g1_i1.p1  ORF type:complete len:338 (+),score=73.16 TRINITY_DN5566_c0_g1_i1:29-1042(+)
MSITRPHLSLNLASDTSDEETQEILGASEEISDSAAENLDFEWKMKIIDRIDNREWREKVFFGISIVLFAFPVLFFFVFGLFLDGDLGTALRNVAIAFLISLGIVALGWTQQHFRKKSYKKKQGRDLFGEKYIGSWVLKKEDGWNAFAETKWGFSSRGVLIVSIAGFLILFSGGVAFVMMVYLGGFSLKDASLAIWIPVGSLFIAVISITLFFGIYQRYRKHDSTFHCCILSKGSYYWMGNMHYFQKWNGMMNPMVKNLHSVSLDFAKIRREKIGMVVLGFRSVDSSGRMIQSEAEIPIPLDKSEEIGLLLKKFSSGYTSNVFLNTSASRNYGTLVV